MAAAATLAPHPRLYIGPRELDRARSTPRLSFLKAAREEVVRLAEEFVGSAVFDYPRDVHNAHLIRARGMQNRVVTLLIRWAQTGDGRFRDAAVEHVREMGRWEYWSWILWRQGDRGPEAIFDLSYGENSATLALAYDILRDTLSVEERGLFLSIARRWSVPAFFVATAEETRQSWVTRKESNWAAVCAGGAGMLALAMYEELPESAEMLARVERTMGLYMGYLKETGGGWTEGVGYWNYGFRYAFMYLLSHERATGKAHPFMQQPETRATLFFPVDFSPNGVAAGFGDSNHWRPLPFHYAAAERLKACEVTAALDDAMARLARSPRPAPRGRRSAISWPDAAELLCLHRGKMARQPRARRNVARLYRGMDWALLCDRLPGPRLYVSVRGGTTKVPHGHRDLLSFNCVVGDEPLVANVNEREYLDTTFGPRREELYEISSASKNTLLINGVGIAMDSSVKTSLMTAGRHKGVRIDASEAMGVMRDGRVARFAGRLILLLTGKALLVLDRVELPHTGRVESRIHTGGKVRVREAGAEIAGRRHVLQAAWASDVPASLHTAVDPVTTPGNAPTMLRWCTEGLVTAVTMAMLLTPGKVRPTVAVKQDGRRLTVEVSGLGRLLRLTFSTHLRPAT
jgi:hypothetical protein